MVADLTVVAAGADIDKANMTWCDSVMQDKSLRVTCPIDSKAVACDEFSMQEKYGPAVGVSCRAQQDMTQDTQSGVYLDS